MSSVQCSAMNCRGGSSVQVLLHFCHLTPHQEGLLNQCCGALQILDSSTGVEHCVHVLFFSRLIMQIVFSAMNQTKHCIVSPGDSS